MCRFFCRSILCFALLIAAPTLAQDPFGPATTPHNPGAATVPDDLEFVEVEITIADWSSAPTIEKTAEKDDHPAQRPQLSGLTQEVAEEVRSLVESGRLVNVQKFRVITADQQSASIQTGAQKPRVTRSQQGPRGNNVSSVEYRAIGTQVTIAPRFAANDQIAFNLSLSRSTFATQPDDPVISEGPANDPVQADTMQTLTLRTVALVPNGQTAIVSGLRDGQQGCLVLLSAKKIPAKSGDGK